MGPDSNVVSSGDVIDAIQEKMKEVIYENAVLRAQIKSLNRKIDELHDDLSGNKES